jgi:hypothetical protein
MSHCGINHNFAFAQGYGFYQKLQMVVVVAVMW